MEYWELIEVLGVLLWKAIYALDIHRVVDPPVSLVFEDGIHRAGLCPPRLGHIERSSSSLSRYGIVRACISDTRNHHDYAFQLCACFISYMHT